MVLSAADRATFDGHREHLARLNAHNAGHVIRGAGHTVSMVRRFVHSPQLGGRYYAPHVTLSEADRARITIDEESTVEVDVKASTLTVLLGVTGHGNAPTDPYAVDGLPRAAVKQWTIQTLGQGAPAGAWGRKADVGASWPAVRDVDGGDCWPGIRSWAALPAVVPADVLRGLPAGAARVGRRAMVGGEGSGSDYGGVGLLHGAGASPCCPCMTRLLSRLARSMWPGGGIEGAYLVACGIVPRVEVEVA